jgi:hypothetical protein
VIEEGKMQFSNRGYGTGSIVSSGSPTAVGSRRALRRTTSASVRCRTSLMEVCRTDGSESSELVLPGESSEK